MAGVVFQCQDKTKHVDENRIEKFIGLGNDCENESDTCYDVNTGN